MKKFQLKENECKIKNFNLEEEIKKLTKLLNIDKVSELKFKNEKKIIKIN